MSSPFNLEASFERASKRFAKEPSSKRKIRSDRGKTRLPREGVELLRYYLQGYEFTGIKTVLSKLAEVCQQRALSCPSRATVYKFIQQDTGPRYSLTELPDPVSAALYNLGGTGDVPGAQLVFYCLNYGDLKAIQYTAGMPWWPLYQAARMRGWRPRSRGLLHAILRARGISRA